MRLIVTARPRQWIKNVLVVARAAGAAGALGRDDVPLRLTLAWAAFCLLASGIYAINDVRDVDEDRIHPGKRFRPIAAGEVDPRLATGFGISVIAAGLVACAAIRPLLALVGVAYVALTLSYTLLWRHIILLDVIAIAGGFVLRAIAGGVAAPVLLSRWFLTVVTCAAVFIAAGKRLAELRRSGGTTRGARKVLGGYTPSLCSWCSEPARRSHCSPTACGHSSRSTSTRSVAPLDDRAVRRLSRPIRLAHPARRRRSCQKISCWATGGSRPPESHGSCCSESACMAAPTRRCAASAR